MSYKVTVVSTSSNFFIRNDSEATNLYSFWDTYGGQWNKGETISLNQGNYIAVRTGPYGNSDTLLYALTNGGYTLFTDKGFVVLNGSLAEGEYEYNLVTFSEVPTSESCRLTSNRLSPPKFRLRKFFRINPRKAMIGG